jgi:hypothetical protein
VNKVKAVIYIILAIVLADFAYENPQPLPILKIFRFELGTIPVFLLSYISLAVGLLVGWITFAWRARKKRRVAAAEALRQQEQEASQSYQERQAP